MFTSPEKLWTLNLQLMTQNTIWRLQPPCWRCLCQLHNKIKKYISVFVTKSQCINLILIVLLKINTHLSFVIFNVYCISTNDIYAQSESLNTINFIVIVRLCEPRCFTAPLFDFSRFYFLAFPWHLRRNIEGPRSYLCP